MAITRRRSMVLVRNHINVSITVSTVPAGSLIRSLRMVGSEADGWRVAQPPNRCKTYSASQNRRRTPDWPGSAIN